MTLVFKPLSANDNVGTSGFNFLRVSYSARSAAMANSFIGLSDDPNAVFYNPAGLVQLSKKMVSSTYINYFEGFHGGSVVFAFPPREDTYLAFFAQYLGNSSITRTVVDEQGNYMGTAGEFGANNIVFGASLSRYIHEMLNIGMTAKLIREQLDEHSATAAAVDLALHHQTTNEQLILGVILKNIGTQITYHTSEEYKEDLPTTFGIGFHYFPHHNLSFVLDLYKPFDHNFTLSAGTEYAIHPMLSLRTGYNTRGGDWRLGGDYDFLSGISLGFGITLNNYVIDYAISSYGDLGLINQVSLQYAF